jgi:hypothetical protein
MPAIGKLGLRVPEVNPFDITNPNLNYVEQNRIDLLRILLNGKVKCSHCKCKFHDGAMELAASPTTQKMENLSVSEWTSDLLPEYLRVVLYCGPCGHKGEYEMSPNPFMDSDNIGKYGALVNAYRDDNNAWPTESTRKEVPRKPRLIVPRRPSFPVPGKE